MESRWDIKRTQHYIDSGADMNVRSGRECQTPLMICAAKGHLKSMRRLMQAGASSTMRDRDGVLPLTRAALAGHGRCIQHLQASASDAHITEAMVAVCRKMHVCGLLWLVRSVRPGILERRDVRGDTPLTAACTRSARCATILLELGANVNATRSDGWTPLAIATRDGRVGVMNALLAHPCIDVNPTVTVCWGSSSEKTMTPLLIAVRMSNSWAVSKLLAHDDVDTWATTDGKRGDEIAYSDDMAALVIEARRTQPYRSRRGKMAARRIQRFLRDTTCNPVYAAARRSLERLCQA